MIKTESKQIGENNYSVTIFTATKSLLIMKKLVKVIGPSMTVLLEGRDDGLFDEDGPLTKAVKLLAENIDKEDVIALIKELISNTHRNGQQINFDMDFAGELGELFQLLTFVVELNYKGFFTKGGSSGLVPQMAPIPQV